MAAAREVFAEHGPDTPMDDVARHAGLGNATLYRHFPTRADLLVAVYEDEVEALCRSSAGLFEWLEEFAVHVATKRELALAITDGRRGALFDRWHASVRATAGALLAPARPDLAVDDVLALVSATALAARDAEHARRLVGILRQGLG